MAQPIVSGQDYKARPASLRTSVLDVAREIGLVDPKANRWLYEEEPLAEEPEGEEEEYVNDLAHHSISTDASLSSIDRTSLSSATDTNLSHGHGSFSPASGSSAPPSAFPSNTSNTGRSGIFAAAQKTHAILPGMIGMGLPGQALPQPPLPPLKPVTSTSTTSSSTPSVSFAPSPRPSAQKLRKRTMSPAQQRAPIPFRTSSEKPADQSNTSFPEANLSSAWDDATSDEDPSPTGKVLTKPKKSKKPKNGTTSTKKSKEDKKGRWVDAFHLHNEGAEIEREKEKERERERDRERGRNDTPVQATRFKPAQASWRPGSGTSDDEENSSVGHSSKDGHAQRSASPTPKKKKALLAALSFRSFGRDHQQHPALPTQPQNHAQSQPHPQQHPTLPTPQSDGPPVLPPWATDGVSSSPSAPVSAPRTEVAPPTFPLVQDDALPPIAQLFMQKKQDRAEQTATLPRRKGSLGAYSGASNTDSDNNHLAVGPGVGRSHSANAVGNGFARFGAGPEGEGGGRLHITTTPASNIPVASHHSKPTTTTSHDSPQVSIPISFVPTQPTKASQRPSTTDAVIQSPPSSAVEPSSLRRRLAFSPPSAFHANPHSSGTSPSGSPDLGTLPLTPVSPLNIVKRDRSASAGTNAHSGSTSIAPNPLARHRSDGSSRSESENESRRAKRRGLNTRREELLDLQIPKSPMAPDTPISADKEGRSRDHLTPGDATIDLGESRPSSPANIAPGTVGGLQRGQSLRGRVSPFPTKPIASGAVSAAGLTAPANPGDRLSAGIAGFGSGRRNAALANVGPSAFVQPHASEHAQSSGATGSHDASGYTSAEESGPSASKVPKQVTRKRSGVVRFADDQGDSLQPPTAQVPTIRPISPAPTGPLPPLPTSAATSSSAQRSVPSSTLSPLSPASSSASPMSPSLGILPISRSGSPLPRHPRDISTQRQAGPPPSIPLPPLPTAAAEHPSSSHLQPPAAQQLDASTSSTSSSLLALYTALDGSTNSARPQLRPQNDQDAYNRDSVSSLPYNRSDSGADSPPRIASPEPRPISAISAYSGADVASRSSHYSTASDSSPVDGTLPYSTNKPVQLMLYPGWANDTDSNFDPDEEIDRNFRNRMSSASTWSLNTLETIDDKDDRNRVLGDGRWPRDVSTPSSRGDTGEPGSIRPGQQERLREAIFKLGGMATR